MNLLEPHTIAEVRDLLYATGIREQDAVRVVLCFADDEVVAAEFEITRHTR
jgi:hypothetical protein